MTSLPDPHGGRSVKEWIGKTPDALPPARVKMRVFLRHNGICHISGRKIQPGDVWQTEHVKALSMGGENRESNLAPALVEPHRDKTAGEAGPRAKADKIRSKHLGQHKSKYRPLPGTKASGLKRKFDGTVERRK